MTVSHISQGPRHLFWGSVLGFLLANFWMADIGNIGKNAYLFSILYVLSFILLFLIMRLFPHEWSLQKQWIFIIATALVVRLAFLAFPASDDTGRYIWEGYLLNKGYNPFIYPANSPVLEPFIDALQDIWEGMNHKDATGCYPPLSMLIFRLAAFLSPTKAFFNLIIVLFDIATVWVLILLVRVHQLPLKRVLLYALNPLVLVFIAGESHLDSIQNFFIWLCFYLLFRKKEHLGFVSSGCAIMSKYFSVIFTPFILNAKNWKRMFFLFGTLFVLYLPFWDTGMHLFTSLKPFGAVMHYNDSLTVFLRDLFGPYTTLVSVVLLAICFAVIFLLVHDPLKSCYLAVGCLLLLIATLHSWYLVLITPFLIFFPSRAWIFLHIAVIFTFPVLHYSYYTGVFQEIHWIKWFEYLPFYGLLLWDTVRCRPYFTDRRFDPVSRISVIIPTLNEAQNIGRCLDAVREDATVLETIVVDGGSTDGTLRIAEEKGAQVLHSAKGRGHQIKSGVLQARGDLILILHADCVLADEVPNHILKKLQKNAQLIGGAVGMRYRQRPLTNRFIEWLNNIRARWTGIAFGDQAQFFRREALSLIGGFPDQMLMEDIELSMRLKEHGQLCFIAKGVVVSSRRWEKMGFCPNFCRVVWLCLSYLVQRRLGLGDTTRRDFYERYNK